MALLEVRDLHVSYGAIKAVQGISFEVNKGETVTLIGANGAGKSSTLNTVIGVVRAASGTITFEGQNITNIPSSVIVKRGIAMSPEGRRIFPRMSVLENLRMGAYSISDQKMLKDGIERAYTLFPILKQRESQMGGTLSGGEQQMLALARALMSAPKLLILDEPSLGLAPIIVQGIFELIQSINKEGTTVLLVEQNARMALNISDRGYVLETGKIVLNDTGVNLSQNSKVKEAYLGK